MRNILFMGMACFCFSLPVNAQTWNRPVDIQSLHITNHTDGFVATTRLEMELYNKEDREVEGLFMFDLKPEQAITGFELELNGKFRAGSVAGSWQAMSAYTAVTGRRVDPAILSREYGDHYSLHVYPVPPKGSRRISITIQQILKLRNDSLYFELPAFNNRPVKDFSLAVNVPACAGTPHALPAFVNGKQFQLLNNSWQIHMDSGPLTDPAVIAYALPVKNEQPVVNVFKEGNLKLLAAYVRTDNTRFPFPIQDVNVYWDVSFSRRQENKAPAIQFVKEYIQRNNIKQLRVVTFNQGIKDIVTFNCKAGGTDPVTAYLAAQDYEGGTNLNQLDFSTESTDAILVFSDMQNSMGNTQPVTGNVPVYTIHPKELNAGNPMAYISGKSGGFDLCLEQLGVSKALDLSGLKQPALQSVNAEGQDIIFFEPDPLSSPAVFLAYGIVPSTANTISFQFNGENGQRINFPIRDNIMCSDTSFARFPALVIYPGMNALPDSVNYDFGIREKIVTRNTSMLVLEKKEDYLKYNIPLPPDLDSVCAPANINWTAAEKDNFKILRAVQNGKANVSLSAPGEGQLMSEVVVTAMGQSRARVELGYSTYRIRSAELTAARSVNLANGLTGKVSGLNVQTVNNGVFADTRITIRGIRSLTGNNQPMLILDGVPIAISYLSSINPNDIQDVTILRSASATAIYGPDGVNGALILTTRKGGNMFYATSYSGFRYNNLPDMPYLSEIRYTSDERKFAALNRLREVYGMETDFYFDMADEFYKAGFKMKAIDLLYSVTDLLPANQAVLEHIAGTMETWKEFAPAAGIYEKLLEQNPDDFSTAHKLGLCYFQLGDSAKARLLYTRILNCRSCVYKYDYTKYTGLMREELKAYNQDSTVVSSDLRVIVENSRYYLSHVRMKGPGISRKNADMKQAAKESYSSYNNMYSGIFVQNIPEAQSGRYTIWANWPLASFSGTNHVPEFVRVTIFRHFGKPDQEMEVRYLNMDNIYGDIGIADIDWKNSIQ